MNYIVYKLASPTGKVYIGKGKSLRSRIKDHVRRARAGCKWHLHLAIAKYGILNFKTEILHENIKSEDEAYRLEIEEIEKHRSQEIGYNLTKGGDGFRGSHTENGKKKISEGFKRWYENHNPEVYKRRGSGTRNNKGVRNPFYGKTHSPEERVRMSDRQVKRSIKGIHKETGKEIFFESLTHAQRHGFDRRHIKICLKIKHYAHKSYHWREVYGEGVHIDRLSGQDIN